MIAARPLRPCPRCSDRTSVQVEKTRADDTTTVRQRRRRRWRLPDAGRRRQTRRRARRCRPGREAAIDDLLGWGGERERRRRGWGGGGRHRRGGCRWRRSGRGRQGAALACEAGIRRRRELRYLLLWLVAFVTRSSTSGDLGRPPLTSHLPAVIYFFFS